MEILIYKFRKRKLTRRGENKKNISFRNDLLVNSFSIFNTLTTGKS